MAKGKGWHGDSAGHSRAAKKRGRTKKYNPPKFKSRKLPKPTKLKVPGMRGKRKVPEGMRTNRRTGTRLYGPNIYDPMKHVSVKRKKKYPFSSQFNI